MSFRLTLAALATTLAAPAFADGHTAPLYAYPASVNYCPAGLQPVTIAGVICCGVPNQHVSYSAMMQHPVRQARRQVSPTYFDNPGIKGTGG